MLAKTKAKNITTAIANPFAKLFIKLGISADLITFIGTLGVSIVSINFLAQGKFLLGVILFTFFVGFDALDGTMARMIGKKSKWGAFFDSVMDRVADGVVLASFAIYYLEKNNFLLVVICLIALIASEIVSYTKARAEGLGLSCDTGLAERPERVLLIMAGSFLAGLGYLAAIDIAMWALAIISIVTVIQRMNFVHKQTK